MFDAMCVGGVPEGCASLPCPVVWPAQANGPAPTSPVVAARRCEVK